MRFGDKYYVCPKCGSNDLERNESGAKGCFVVAAIAFLFAPMLAILIILVGVPYMYFTQSNDEEKNKIWKIHCKTCNHIFNIPDPTLKNNNSNNNTDNNSNSGNNNQG